METASCRIWTWLTVSIYFNDDNYVTNSLPLSSLGTWSSIFLLLCSTCLSTSLVHFKNYPDYLTKDKTLVLFFNACPVGWGCRIRLLLCREVRSPLMTVHLTPSEFFTLALAGGFPQETEWQQFSLSFQDSSQYSGRSQKKL